MTMSLSLINDNETLCRFIPNHFAQAAGEQSFFDKIKPSIVIASQWLEYYIVGASFAPSIDTVDGLREALTTAAANFALFLAVPSLDLVLTPNGYGIVNTSNVAPASKERVAALKQSLFEARDIATAHALAILLEQHLWRDSAVGANFRQSLFLHPDDVRRDCPFDEFFDFRIAAAKAEHDIAEKAVSPQIMKRLRAKYRCDESPAEARLAAMILDWVRAKVAPENKGHRVDSIDDIVNFIKENAYEFPEWELSDTAKLFSPPVFANTKSSSGFWF